MEKKEKTGRALSPAKVAKGMIVTGAYVLYRPKFVYENKKVQKRKLESPCVIIANHSNVKDAPFLMSIFDGGMATIMAKDWYDRKSMRWLFEGNNCIPIDRYGLDTSWLYKSIEEIKHGNSVVIFPEGHTVKGKDIDVFKPGFLMLAIMSGAPILPICLDCEYHAVGKRKKVLIGEPVKVTPPPGGMTPEYLTEESEKFRCKISEMQKKLDTVNSWI